MFGHSMSAYLQEGLPYGHGAVQSALFMGLSVVSKETSEKINALKSMDNAPCEYFTMLFPVNQSKKLPLIIIRLAKDDQYIYRIPIDLGNAELVKEINNPDNSNFHNFILFDQDMTDLKKMFNVRYKGSILFDSLQALLKNNPSLSQEDYYQCVKDLNNQFPDNAALINHIS